MGDIVTANMSLIALNYVMWNDYEDDDVDDIDDIVTPYAASDDGMEVV